MSILKSLLKRTSLRVVGAGIVVLVSFIFYMAHGDDKITLNTVLLSISTNLIASGIVFVLAVALWQGVKDEIRQEELRNTVLNPLLQAWSDNHQFIYPTVDAIPWKELFCGATTIDMLVQGWDGWQKKVNTVLPEFLLRGGKINLILHDPKEVSLLVFHAQRMNRTQVDMIREIEQTITSLEAAIRKTILSEEDARSRLTVHHIKKMNWFCGIRFNNEKLLLSLYEHKSETAWGHIDSPSFLVRTDIFDGIGKWFAEEWDYLRSEMASNSTSTPGAPLI